VKVTVGTAPAGGSTLGTSACSTNLTSGSWQSITSPFTFYLGRLVNKDDVVTATICIYHGCSRTAGVNAYSCGSFAVSATKANNGNDALTTVVGAYDTTGACGCNGTTGPC
jgi:hypothetical protein